MRITPNTSIDDLCHSEVKTQDTELTHWLKKGEAAEEHKYIKREWRNGRWRYWYDTDTSTSTNNVKTAVTNAVKTTASNVSNTVITKTNEASKGLNSLVDKAKSLINKLYDDPKNIYDVTSASYETKLAKVKETKEWKDIVARSDPEYVRKNADGSTSYLIDDYVVKKKHPVLDVLSDIASGREVGINEITRESTVAGLKDHAISYLRAGMLGVAVVSTVLHEKFKLQQGSYDDEIKELASFVESGADYVKQTIDVASKVKPEDVERLAAAARKGSMTVEATRSIREGNIVKAAQTILEAEEMRSIIGNNAYYDRCTEILGDLSEEEKEALNLLLKQMRK